MKARCQAHDHHVSREHLLDPELVPGPLELGVLECPQAQPRNKNLNHTCKLTLVATSGAEGSGAPGCGSADGARGVDVRTRVQLPARAAPDGNAEDAARQPAGHGRALK